MNLEDLVPPLELCKQIPEGAFADSVFWRVWSAVERRYILCQRGTGAFINTAAIPCPCGMKYTYPAPTLAEIVARLTPGEDGCGEITQFGKDKRGWFMMASFEGNDDGYGSLDTYEEIDPDNPAAAALKLWLEVKQ